MGMGKFAKHKWWMLTVLLTVPIIAVAAGVPNIFSAGTPIVSQQINDNFKNLADRLTAIEGQSRSLTYTRWGRTTCPTGANVIYTGYAAGTHYTQTGSGAGTLCLHNTPEWLQYDDADQNGALLYGTEFETNGFGVASLKPLQDFEAQCVVCEVPRVAQLMIPGRISCPTGWTLEYNGYLMSEYYTGTHYRSDWVCVDAAPEMKGSSANQDGHLFYPTEIECGSLPCQNGGYVQNREVACAVCTK